MTLTDVQFDDMLRLARLAPSIHNTQPARWRRVGGTVEVAADTSIQLPQADPTGAGLALSVGAAVEATVLALSQIGLGADVVDVWADQAAQTWTDHRIAVQMTLRPAPKDPLVDQLAQRGTWRGRFGGGQSDLYGWTRADTRLITDAPTKAWIAQLNDSASLDILRSKAFRQELVSWMRLKDSHPRAGFDGMDLKALRMDARAAKTVKLGFGPLWSVMDALGRAKAMISEADVTKATPVIAVFHRPTGESPIETGRAYLRMWLEATQLGLAGWPMAALTDTDTTRAQLQSRLGIGADRQLIQVLRFGEPTAELPRKARRPLPELTQ